MSDVSGPRVSFSIRAVLSTSIETLGRGWLKLIGLTLPPWVLGFLLFFGVVYAALRLAPETGFSTSQINGGRLALFAAFALNYAVCQAALTHGVAELLRGRSFGFRRAMAAGLSRFGLIFGVGVLTVAICIGFILASTLLAAVLPRFLAMPATALLCVIGGSMVASAFFVVLPIAAMENHNAPGCFERSRSLTRGYRWPIFGLFLILTIGYSMLCIAASLLGEATLPPMLGLIIPVVFQIGLTTLVSVLVAVAYFRLRFLKEGAGLDHIAAVFE